MNRYRIQQAWDFIVYPISFQSRDFISTYNFHIFTWLQFIWYWCSEKLLNCIRLLNPYWRKMKLNETRIQTLYRLVRSCNYKCIKILNYWYNLSKYLHFTLRARIIKNFNICVNALKPQRKRERARWEGKGRNSVRHYILWGEAENSRF
jgi:hypothetical protein